MAFSSVVSLMVMVHVALGAMEKRNTVIRSRGEGKNTMMVTAKGEALPSSSLARGLSVTMRHHQSSNMDALREDRAATCPGDCNASGHHCDCACNFVFLDTNARQNGLSRRCDDFAYISSASECEAAAASLGLCDTTANIHTSAGNPRGCWFGGGGGCSFVERGGGLILGQGSLYYNNDAIGGNSSLGRHSLCALQALWPQFGDDNSKCGDWDKPGAPGMYVNNQHECQSKAMAEGHNFYQYRKNNKGVGKCLTVSSCDEKSGVDQDWSIFKNPQASM